MNLELKPCPFCGGEARLFVDNGVRVICPSCRAGTRPFIDCMTARAVVGNATLRAIKAWNQRVGAADPLHRSKAEEAAMEDLT